MFSKVLQYLWAITSLLAFSMAVYNLLLLKDFVLAVYMPFILGILCAFLFFSFKHQNNFKKQKDKNLIK